MPSSAIEVSPAAERDLRKLPSDIRPRIVKKISALATTPRPPGVKKLVGDGIAGYRVRVGDYRVLHEIDDAVLRILVVHIAHRRDAYR